MTAAATYTVTLLDPVDTAELQRRVEVLLAAETIIRERKQGKKGRVKQYDLRPLLHELKVEKGPDEHPLLTMTLSLMPGKSGRAGEVLRALGLDPLAARIHRTRIALQEEEEQAL